MIRIFEENPEVPRYHKNHNIYGDYILAVRGNIYAMKNIMEDALLNSPLHSKLTNSVYDMPRWTDSLQGRLFWENYVKEVEDDRYNYTC